MGTAGGHNEELGHRQGCPPAAPSILAGPRRIVRPGDTVQVRFHPGIPATFEVAYIWSPLRFGTIPEVDLDAIAVPGFHLTPRKGPIHGRWQADLYPEAAPDPPARSLYDVVEEIFPPLCAGDRSGTAEEILR